MQVNGVAISFIPSFLKKFGKAGYTSWVASLHEKSKAIHGSSIHASRGTPSRTDS